MNVKNAIVQGENYRFNRTNTEHDSYGIQRKRCVCRQEDSDGCK